MNRRHLLLAGTTALSMLILESSQSFGYTEYSVSRKYVHNGETLYDSASGWEPVLVNYSTFSGPVQISLGPDDSISWNNGYADARNLKTGTYSYADANGNTASAYMLARAENQFTVLPGTSGLTYGQPTTLQFQVSLDGTLHGGSASWPNNGFAWAMMGAELTISDPDIQDCAGGDGCWSPDQVRFRAGADLQSYDWYADYPYYSYGDQFWSTESNISPENYQSDWQERMETREGYTWDQLYFDTGLQTVAFEAVVGHTLNLAAYLDTEVYADYDALAWADFRDTLQFDVLADNGVEIAWGAPQAVPVPGSLLLLGSGVLGLLGVRRKAKS